VALYFLTAALECSLLSKATSRGQSSHVFLRKGRNPVPGSGCGMLRRSSRRTSCHVSPGRNYATPLRLERGQ
jgi:hypothetical protein